MATRNIVPRANGEGSIGTAAKHWGSGWINDVNTDAVMPVGNDNKIGMSNKKWKEGHFEKLFADDVIAKGPVVDVRAFGAVGDGVHDDTAAIQAAIDAGNIVIFPIGEYYITDSITVRRSNVIVCGENAVINANSMDSAYSFIFKTPVNNADSALYEGPLRVSNIKMKGVTIKGNTACVAILNVDDFIIENCNVTANNEAFNICFCKNYNVSNNVIISNDGAAYGIFNYQSKKFIEENNRITANLCIVVKGSYNQEEYVDAIIAGNYLNLLTSSGNGISSGSVVEEGAVKRCIVKNNYIYAYGASINEVGIRLSRKAEEWVVSENIIIGCNINVCANNHVIKGNVIRNTKEASIRVASDVESLNSSCIIENNYLTNNTACAIELSAGSKHIVVCNYMNNCEKGILIAGGVSENIIINNYGVEQDYVVKTNDEASRQFTVSNFSINNNAGTPMGTNTTGLRNSNLVYYNKNSAFKDVGIGGYRGQNGFDRTTGINLYDNNKSKEYHMWIDSLGRLRIHDDVPTSDNDGTVVGTQS